MAETEPIINDVNTCQPIRTIEELNNFMANPTYWAQLVIPIEKRSKIVKNSDLYRGGTVCHISKHAIEMPARYDYGSVPKTLVCHDMKNGYQDDRFVNGSDNMSAYSFYHWAGIDIFVYFSHHFITIPPLGWINVAHRHGVQILGTIITEWQGGSQICEEILKSEEDMETFVHQLVAITNYFKIDGWLLNFENRVDKIDMLLKFVQYLTLKMHHENPDSVVIWYDSVTKDGELSWQNCLNPNNRLFFDACDGIFTNYCWQLSHLQRCVEEAGPRIHDVYVGVDVWGRNFWGGGCFNTASAIKEIHNFGLSLAIFAPAWTHEAIQFSQVMDQQYRSENIAYTTSCAAKSLETNEITSRNRRNSHYFRKCAEREHFFLRENAFWNTLWPYLNTRGPSQLPFQTSFCLGSGEKKWIDGEVIEDNLWFNLRDQQYQSSFPFCSNAYYLERVFETPLNFNPRSEAEEMLQNRDKRETVDDKDTAHEDELHIRENVDDKIEDSLIQSVSDIKVETDASKPKIILDCANLDAKNSTCSASASAKEETILVKTNIPDSETPSVRSKPTRPPIKRFIVKPNRENASCISIYGEDSFHGGNCLKLTPVNPEEVENDLMRLLICEFVCDHNFLVYYAVKNLDDADGQDLNLIISLKNNRTGTFFNVVLTDNLSENTLFRSGEIIVNRENEKDEKFKKLQEHLLSTHPGFYIPIFNEKFWKIRYFVLNYPNSTMLEVNCELINKSAPLLLGGLGIAKDVVSF